MAFTKIEESFPCKNGENEIKYKIYQPLDNTRAVVLFAHSFFDYSDYYESFFDFLTQNDIAVVTYDQLGHGKTAEKPEELGIFSKKHSDKHLVEDMFFLTAIVKKIFPRLPFFIFGNGLGAIVASRLVIYQDNICDGLILAGIPSKYTFLDAHSFYLSLSTLFKGKKFKSKKFNEVAFSAFRENLLKVEDKSASKSKNQSLQRGEDELCNFYYSNGALRSFVKLVSYVQSVKWLEKYPKSLPISLIGCENDPIGRNGKTVTKLGNILLKNNFSDVKATVYKDRSHDFLSEKFKEVPFAEILAWLNIYIKKGANPR